MSFISWSLSTRALALASGVAPSILTPPLRGGGLKDLETMVGDPPRLGRDVVLVPFGDRRLLGGHLALERGDPGRVDLLQHRDHGRDIHLQDIDTVFHHAVDYDFLFIHGFHFLDIGHVRPVQPGGDPGAHVAGVPVVGLLAANHEVDRALFLGDLLDTLEQGVGRRPGVRAGEGAARQMKGLVRPARDGLAKRLFRLGRPHGDDRDRAPRHALLDPHALFNGVLVEGVDGRRHALAFQGPGDRVNLDVGSGRRLLDADNDMQSHYSPLAASSLVSIMPISFRWIWLVPS